MSGSLKRSSFSIKLVLLIVLIAVLVGIIVYQQVEINNLLPITQQESKTQLAWNNLAVSLYLSEIQAIGPNTSLPSMIVLTIAHDNSSCASDHQTCDGYDYFFGIQNVCANSTYYGTCNFGSVVIYWFDPTNNVLFTTSSNVTLPQGQLVMIHGNWPSGYAPSDRFPLLVEVSTSGGWAAATMSITS